MGAWQGRATTQKRRRQPWLIQAKRKIRRISVFPQTLSISCPKCGTVIPLSETLARPFLDAERSKLRQEQEEQSAALKCREEELANRRDALEKLEKQLRQRQQSIAT